MTAGLYEGTLGGAADLDPLDLGPAHLALPATVAACVASRAWGDLDDDILDAVVAGMEAGSRLRRTLTGVRPGAGLHSVSTFGLFAAAAATARVLRLGPVAFANSIAIGLTRAGGLSLNNASTRIGLTHFGWAVAHGIEAGWLAAQGVEASLDVATAFEVLFAGSTIDLSRLETDAPLLADSAIVFKHYPCNIYLNLIVKALFGHAGTGIDRIRVVMPNIKHLDQPAPRGVREFRNSAQAVAAASALYPPDYRSYTAAFIEPAGNPTLWQLISAVEVVRDSGRETGLERAVVDVEAFRAGRVVATGSHRMTELRSWSLAHATELVGDIGPTGWVDQVYSGTYLEAHDVVSALVKLPA
jgi:2-methylcitrate dehydratase PrpD